MGRRSRPSIRHRRFDYSKASVILCLDFLQPGRTAELQIARTRAIGPAPGWKTALRSSLSPSGEMRHLA
jgi:hypothetical protein